MQITSHDRSGALALLLLALSFAAVVSPALALYADQAGEKDWYKQHIGIPTHAAFHPTKPKACVATAQSTLGCINLRDGSIAWRKYFGTEEGGVNDLLQLDEPPYLLAASHGGSVLRAYDVAEGYLKWEKVLIPGSPSLNESSRSVALINNRAGGDSSGGSSTVAILAAGSVKVLDARTGSVVLTKAVPSLAVQHVHAWPARGDLLLAGYDTGSHTIQTARVTASGEVQDVAVHASTELSGVAASGPAGLAVLSLDGTHICTLPVGGSSVTCAQLSAVASQLPVSSELRLTATSVGFAVASSSGVALLQLFGDVLTLQLFQQEASAVTPTVGSGEAEAIGLLHIPSPGALSVRVLSTATGSLLHEDFISKGAGSVSGGRLTSDSVLPVLSQVFLGTYKRSGKADGFRTLVTWDDGAVAMVQQGVVVWMRDEAASSTVATLFEELPPVAAHDTGLDAGSHVNFTTKIKFQLLSVKVQIKLADAAEAAEYIDLKQTLSDKNQPVRDANGFRKIILLATGTGKLLALHNGDGRTLWAHHFGSAAPAKYLLPWRTFHDIQHAPQVLVVHDASPPFASVVDVHTGKVVETLPLTGSSLDKVIKVTGHLHDGKAEQTVYLLVSTATAASPKVSLLPDTAATRAYFSATYRSLYFWTHVKPSHSLCGYGFTQQAADGVVGSVIEATPTWTVALPDEVLALASRDPEQSIQTSVKLLGNRSIKYRYLNPNTLFVATGASASAADDTSIASPDDDDLPLHKLTAYLIDTVTGRILYRAVHPGARGPVTALFTENLVAYQYWDAVAMRFAVTSLELFDATPRDFSVLDYLFNPNSTAPSSSFDASPLEVVSMSVWARLPAVALASTATARGITSKHVLIGTPSGQVYGLDQRFLDPRRPRKATLNAEEIEERLMPYQDTLPMHPFSFTTYNRQVLGLRRIQTQAARLESTSLVLAYGVDLFYTRLTPSRSFDSLEDDFSYGLLVVALAALLIGSTVMNFMTKETLLKSKWK